jgi:MFS family permease
MTDSVALPPTAPARPWWREATRYHWLVLFLASGGWLFDCMGQRIFILAREPALRELLGPTAPDGTLKLWGGQATMMLMIGWATGGILFGILSDKYGRVRAMVATLVAYTISAGLSGMARNGTEFCVYRFVCGMGVGGMFGSATTLLAESVTPRFRTFALGVMQSISAFGNILASGLSLWIVPTRENLLGPWSGWRVLFFVGVLPIGLVVPIVLLLKEPQAWKRAKAEAAAGRGKKMGSYAELLANPTWYYTALVAALCGLGFLVVPRVVPGSWPKPPINAMLTLILVAATFWTICGNRSGSRLALLLIVISMVFVGFLAPPAWPKGTLLLFMAGLAAVAGYFMLRFLPQKELPSQIRWRRSTHIGICFGVAGMVGLWGIAFFSPELITAAFKNRPLLARELIQPATICAGLKTPANSAVAHVRGQLSPEVRQLVDEVDPGRALPDGARAALLADLNRLIQTPTSLYDAQAFQSVTLTKATANLVGQAKREKPDTIMLNRQLVEQLFPGTIAAVQKTINTNIGRGTLLQDVGAMLGTLAFTWLASRFNRRTAFLLAFSFCLVVVAFVFYALQREADVYWMLPLMGFGTLSCFAGYSIYFPEIFPTRLRGTGVSFCYNTVRYFAAPFPMLLGWLTLNTTWSFRHLAMVMCLIYLVGIVALLWAPETKGQPLPED